MRVDALAYLVCPCCGGAVRLSGGAAESDGHVMTGELECNRGSCYPIVRGVPWFVPKGRATTTAAEATETASRFGVQWGMFDHQDERHEQQFLDWVAPLESASFRDQVVLEGGCGKGRHTRLVAGYGARAIVAIDLGDSVDVAFEATRPLPNVHIIQGDLATPPVGRVFDIAFSIGVLHHLPDPRAGFSALWSRVREGGRVAIWVYGHESNEWIVRWVNPVRQRVTSRMPESMLYWLSLPPSAGLAAALRLYRNPSAAKKLPYGAYLHYISRFGLREVHNIVFDQLVTPVAYYLREQEVRDWFDVPELAIVSFNWHNENSWRVCATVQSPQQSE